MAPKSAFDSNQWNTAIGLGGTLGLRRSAGLGWVRVPMDESNSRECYSKVAENAFKSVRLAPISTFGVDVDTASYTNVRRFLRYGQLPPADAVRVEEMINYFRYDYPAPAKRDSFSVTLERGVCPWNTDHELVLVGLQGRTVDPEKAPPRNLVFLIDVSGSMRSPDKLPLVKRSLARLVNGLADKDSVAIVTYAGKEAVALEPSACADKKPILACIESLGAGGSTNGAGGIQKSYELARTSFHKEQVNRVILVTDGDFNVGIRDTTKLTRLIEKERETGVFLTVVGVGTGNLRDGLMSSLAKHGNGQYIYLDSEDEARRKFENGLTGTLITIAKDVKLQVEFNPNKVAGYRLIGYERRVMKKEDFRDDKKDSGEIGAGHCVTALYELVPAGRSVPGVDASSEVDGETMEVRLRYKAPWAEKAKESSFKLSAAAKSGPNLEFASAVAVFGMVLARSSHQGRASLDLAAELAARSLGRDPDGLRKEFVTLVEIAGATIRAVGGAEARKKAELALHSTEARHWRTKLPAVQKGLQWLVSQQREDGGWRGDDAGPTHDLGVTGLAVLAFLGNRNTMRSGPYKHVVKAGVKWLRRRQSGDGLYSSDASGGSLLDHVIAAYAMTEAYGLSKYKTLKRNAVAGRNYLIRRQAEGSVRTLGWQILLEQSAVEFGLATGSKELRAAAPDILKQPGDERAPTTLLERFLLRGEALAENEPVPAEADKILGLDPNTLGKIDAAAFFFGARALCEVGGKHLEVWREKKCAAILASQRPDGTFGGNARVDDTALMVLALEEPTRYLRAWHRR